MSELKKSRTFNRKNTKGLALSAPPTKAAAPSAGDAQIPGALGNDVTRTDTLEIGVEFKLDLRSEDLIVLKELGAGNGGTVSKVMHAATKVIMAKKVGTRTKNVSADHIAESSPPGHPCGSKKGCAEADCSGITHHARLYISKYCDLLWCIFAQFWRCGHVHGIYGLRVDSPPAVKISIY